MKNLLKYIWVIGVVTMIFSCTKDNDPAFSTTQAERIDSITDKYTNALIKGDGRWIAVYDNKIIEMVFSKDGTVSFTSNVNGGAEDRTVTYRVGSSQVPELVFQSHTVFHALYDANSSLEYQFLFKDVTDNKITFESKTDVSDKTKIVFYKANDDSFGSAEDTQKQLIEMKSFKKITKEGSKYLSSVMINGNNSVEIIRKGKDVVDNNITIEYTIDATIITFANPIDVDGVEVTKFVYDKTKKMFVAENDSTITMSDSDKPAIKLTSYDIGVEASNFRIVETNSGQISNAKSSFTFRSFLDKWRNDISSAGLTVERFYFMDLDAASWLRIVLKHPDGGLTQFFFDFSYEVTDSMDGQVVKFTKIGPGSFGTALPDNFDTSLLDPIADLIFSPEGFLMHESGGLGSRDDSQRTVQLTSIKDPTMTIHCYTF